MTNVAGASSPHANPQPLLNQTHPPPLFLRPIYKLPIKGLYFQAFRTLVMKCVRKIKTLFISRHHFSQSAQLRAPNVFLPQENPKGFHDLLGRLLIETPQNPLDLQQHRLQHYDSRRFQQPKCLSGLIEVIVHDQPHQNIGIGNCYFHVSRNI